MVAGGALVLPWIAYGIVRRRVAATALFTLSVVVPAMVLGLISGSPRAVTLRDIRLTAVIGLWLGARVPGVRLSSGRGALPADPASPSAAAAAEWSDRLDPAPPVEGAGTPRPRPDGTEALPPRPDGHLARARPDDDAGGLCAVLARWFGAPATPAGDAGPDRTRAAHTA